VLASLAGAAIAVKLPCIVREDRACLTGRPGHSEWGSMDTLNSRLAMITLPDADGRELRLGSLWLRQPAVLVFLRHYG